MKRLFAAAAIGIGLSTLCAGPAHADDNGYLAELSAAGVPMINSPAQQVGGGYQVCGMLRNGMSLDMAAQQFGMLNQWGPAIVAAAQHNLCPDTLR